MKKLFTPKKERKKERKMRERVEGESASEREREREREREETRGVSVKKFSKHKECQILCIKGFKCIVWWGFSSWDLNLEPSKQSEAL
jgi:hypothetical protein